MLTLKEKLDELIQEYGLVEVLDRISELTHKLCKTEDNCNGCDRVTALIEDARDVARQHTQES